MILIEVIYAVFRRWLDARHRSGGSAAAPNGTGSPGSILDQKAHIFSPDSSADNDRRNCSVARFADSQLIYRIRPVPYVTRGTINGDEAHSSRQSSDQNRFTL